MTFLPGLVLCRLFHDEVVAAVLADVLPGVRYTAARVDFGSDLFGFDTPRSMDHDWGPRLQIFLDPEHRGRLGAELPVALAERLPATFRGFPTHFEGHGDTKLGVLAPLPQGQRLRHGVSVTDMDVWFGEHLGFDPRTGVTPLDWLATPTQRLAEITAGAIFHDDLGLESARRALSWYPDDLWRYALASAWTRIAQEEAFVGRCGEVGDDLGGTVVTARLVRELMRLSLLLARQWPPYGKWLGTAFGRLPIAAQAGPALRGALSASDWRDRERHLGSAYQVVGAASNATGLAAPVDAATRGFHDRPYRVLRAERLAGALRESIHDPWIRELPLVGGVDQVVDSTDVLTHPVRCRALVRALLPEDPNER